MTDDGDELADLVVANVVTLCGRLWTLIVAGWARLRGRGGDMAVIEIWSGSHRQRTVSLDSAVVTVGSDEQADVALDDPTVSQVHAVLERVGSTWLVRDVGSRNGTRLNGGLLDAQRRLRNGDELTLGRTRLVFADQQPTPPRTTDALRPAPTNLTRGEHRVLVELCRPLLTQNALQPPASVREIAERLYIGRNAVQAHLVNLYDKFGLHEDDTVNRRVLLANEAIQRGAVSRASLRADTDQPT